MLSVKVGGVCQFLTQEEHSLLIKKWVKLDLERS